MQEEKRVKETRLKLRNPRLPLRRIGRGLGRGFRATGRGLREAGAGFAEGVGPISRPSPRAVGKVAGVGIKAGVRTLGKVEFKDPSYFWGPRAKVAPSRLPTEVQMAMVQYLAEMYPEQYQAIHTPGIRVSEFIGKLKAYYPQIYEDIKSTVYASLTTQRFPSTPQYPQTYRPMGYPGYGPYGR